MGASLKIIEENSLRAYKEGFEIKVRLNWYRSLPLSCVSVMKLSIDGEIILPERISFIFNDQEYKLNELPELVNIYWFVQDSAILRASMHGKFTSGETHEVEIGIALRMPYIPIGPDKFLTLPTFSKTIQLAS
jgi:hypothetical protein